MMTRLSLGLAVMVGLSLGAGEAFAQDYRRCDHSTDEIINGNVDGQSHIVFHGRVGRLIVQGKVDGQSTLDLRDVHAGVIFIRDKVDGQSRVLIGQGQVIQIGGKIDGQSDVIVDRCDTFTVDGKVDGGPGTKVHVNFRGAAVIKGGIHGLANARLTRVP